MAARRPPGLARRSPEESRPTPVDDSDSPGHTHRLPRALLLTLVVICSGLVVSIVLVSMLAHKAQDQADETNRRLEALEGFIAERGEARDEQYKTLDERITRKICDALEALPAGGLLDEVRAENGCGPGVPIEELSPAARADLRRYSTGQPLTTTDGFDLGDYYAQPDERIPDATTPDRKTPRRDPQETPDAPSPTSASPAPSVAPDVPTAAPVPPAPASTAAPLVDTNPITEPVCNLLGICR